MSKGPDTTENLVHGPFRGLRAESQMAIAEMHLIQAFLDGCVELGFVTEAEIVAYTHTTGSVSLEPLLTMMGKFIDARRNVLTGDVSKPDPT